MKYKKQISIFLVGIMLFSLLAGFASMMVDNPNTEMETGTVVDEEFKLNPIAVRSHFFNSSILIEQNITNNTNVSDMKFLSAIAQYENETFIITDSEFGTIIDLEYNEDMTEEEFDLYLTGMQPVNENLTYYTWSMETGNESFVTNHKDMDFKEDIALYL